ncbi:MAG: SUF system NifU family Fe-S cluster assembly protein [Phycisphaerales bacterium]|nr:SUF system NifU family Fe-S cluster assembly protein [Phycisphaerales bacterium]
MSELTDLYQELILDHNKRPRNRGALDGANRTASGHNPLCGDRIVLQLRMNGDAIEDAKFDGCGCAISTASASMMTEAIRGKTIEEAEAIGHRFREAVMSDGATPIDAEALGKLAAFGGVRAYPARVKCATLAWHTLDAALHDVSRAVSTE